MPRASLIISSLTFSASLEIFRGKARVSYIMEDEPSLFPVPHIKIILSFLLQLQQATREEMRCCKKNF
jgi:hypothetical protein